MILFVLGHFALTALKRLCEKPPYKHFRLDGPFEREMLFHHLMDNMKD